MGDMKTIVSVTPLKVQEDSRTFKQAASFTRFGYKSIVVEGQPSDLNKACLPFELISIGGVRGDGQPVRENGNQSKETSENTVGRIGAFKTRILKLIHSIYDPLPEPLKDRLPMRSIGFVQFLFFFLFFMYVNFFLPVRYIPKANLYYLHSPVQYPAIYFLCKKYRVPFIYDAHDFYSRIEEKGNRMPYNRRWTDPFLFRLEKSCIQHAIAVVTVCDGVANLLEETFKCHPIVARNCHDYRLDQSPKMDLRQLLGLSPDKFILVTIGAAKPGQAIEESLDAMQKLPSNVHLAFVGKNTDQHLDLIRQRKLEGRVHAVPPVMPFEVVPFVRSADASLILYYSRSPNYENCLPNGLFQAIAAELPLLYPELPEISKIAKRYDLGIPINPLDPESISSGVLQLMTNPQQFSAYRKNLRVAREELGWEREEVVLRELLSKVLGQDSEKG